MKTERLFLKAIAAIRTSDKGRVSPFFRKEAEISLAFCHRDCDISIYGKSDSMSNTLDFSSSVLTPRRISKRTGPQSQTDPP